MAVTINYPRFVFEAAECSLPGLEIRSDSELDTSTESTVASTDPRAVCSMGNTGKCGLLLSYLIIS